MKWFAGAISLACIAAFALTSSSAAPAQDADWDAHVQACRAELGGANPIAPDAKIAGCTWLLESGRLTDPGTAEVLTLRSLAYSAKRDTAGEMKDLDGAVAADPTSAFAWAESCSAHMWTSHDAARAAKDCSTAIQLAPSDPEGWTYRGDISLYLHNYDRAIADYNHAIALNPKWMWPLDNRGEAYLRSNKFDQAIQDFNAVIAVAPDYAMGYLDRGIARIRMHDLNAARNDFETALKVEPKNAAALYGRGLVKVLRGDRAGGKADIAAAKAISSHAPENFDRDGVRAPD
jgi:tetratricopeptide (TPR) repeat protein